MKEKTREDRGPELQGDELDVHHEEHTVGGHERFEQPVLRVKYLRGAGGNLTSAYGGDAGIDLSFNPADGRSAVVSPGAVSMLDTGVAVAIPEGYAGLVLPRSSKASLQGLRPINTPGLIDSGYRGEIVVAMEAVLLYRGRQVITPGERIAQLVIVPILSPTVEVVDELDDTERGDGGFGSSGS